MMGRAPGLQRPQTAAQKAIRQERKRRSSLATKTADDAFQRYEEAWFNFHRFTRMAMVSSIKELAELLMDLKMHVARAHRSEEQMANGLREIQKNDERRRRAVICRCSKLPFLCTHERVRAFSPVLLCVHDFVPSICIRCRVLEYYTCRTTSLTVRRTVRYSARCRARQGCVRRGRERHAPRHSTAGRRRCSPSLAWQVEGGSEAAARRNCRLGVADHPNLVSLMDVFEEPSSLILITEILRGGDLLRRLQAERRALL